MFIFIKNNIRIKTKILINKNSYNKNYIIYKKYNVYIIYIYIYIYVGPPGAGGRGQSLANPSKRRLLDGVTGGRGLMMSMATMTSTPIASGISNTMTSLQPRPMGQQQTLPSQQQQPWMPNMTANTPRPAPGLGYNNNPYGPR